MENTLWNISKTAEAAFRKGRQQGSSSLTSLIPQNLPFSFRPSTLSSDPSRCQHILKLCFESFIYFRALHCWLRSLYLKIQRSDKNFPKKEYFSSDSTISEATLEEICDWPKNLYWPSFLLSLPSLLPRTISSQTPFSVDGPFPVCASF